ncbi:hypothetical protein JK386_16835 [Nocardioides sp. zg-536]|uniref:Uncharacterized protein n=1 Tax=Nocardioides faecalis TaxID=2803858 RepID=A0A938YCY1_9ACTN|nr:hypothetical protein [Nocardioides faecalis]MBM9461569.1 hypothetical protein [Nocardioides faecalis]QVI57797.1 hypothetical protein KG111_12070 [Nocardioides faecalis]
MDAIAHRRAVTELQERLVAEFSDTVPAGRILRIVNRADHLVLSAFGRTSDALTLCEGIARRLIAGRMAEHRADPRFAVPVVPRPGWAAVPGATGHRSVSSRRRRGPVVR